MLKIVQEKLKLNTQLSESFSQFALFGEKFRIENEHFSISKEIEKASLDADINNPPKLEFKKTSSSEDEPEYDKISLVINSKSYFKGPKYLSD